VPLAPLRCALVTSGAALIVLGGGAALASTGPLPRLSDVVALVSADGSPTAPAQALRARHHELSEQLRQLEAAVDAAEQTSGTPGPASTASDAPQHTEADSQTATEQNARTAEPTPTHASAPSRPADRTTTRTAVHVPDQVTHPRTVHETTHGSQPEEENERGNDDD